MVTAVYAALFYVATLVLLAGVAAKLVRYARTPAPLKIPTTPAPTTYAGVAVRMVREITLFESLFKANKWIWVFGWLFHFGLLLVLIRHLRYFVNPVPELLAMIQPIGINPKAARYPADFAAMAAGMPKPRMEPARAVTSPRIAA